MNVQRPPTNIPLGRQGENLATCIIFDCSGFAQLYGDGTAELLHELKDGTIYPVAVTQDGTSVSWIVTASDTATVGAGRAELRWYVGDTLAKSAKFRTSVSSALADSTTETPPEPQKSWVDTVLQAAQEIKDGAILDEKLAEAIAAYLEEHPIDAGLDEAALAAYLTENGYLTDAALADAITQALAEAKESGEFDGDPGEAGADGSPGADGADGVGIQSVVQTTTSAEDGGTNVITVTKTDGSTSTFEVRNGSKGSDGAPGKDGTDGAPGADGKNGADGQPGTSGKSAYQYAQEGGYAGTETEFAEKLAEENASKAYADQLNENKLDKPATPPSEAGKVLRVLAVNEDGTFTCEWADPTGSCIADVQISGESIVSDCVAIIPLALNDKAGLVRFNPNAYSIASNSDGFVYFTRANEYQISLRIGGYFPITPAIIDYSVKAAMCDGNGSAWTDAERISALLRMGCTVDDNGFVKWGASE